MQAILYIGHGTRYIKGVAETYDFIQSVKSSVKVPIQEVAFLEIVTPSIEQGVRRCIELGATKIALVPLLLLTAQHAKVDIPEQLETVQKKYPLVHFTYGEPFGIHENLLQTVLQKVAKQNQSIGECDELLLIGRGSSDPAIQKDMEEICALLEQQSSFEKVRACYLYGKGLSFEEALVHYSKEKNKQVFIVPYLLFSGLLSVGIEKKMKEWRQENPQLILCEKLGYNDNVKKVLLERMKESLKMEGILV